MNITTSDFDLTFRHHPETVPSQYDKKISFDDLSADQKVALDALYELSKQQKSLITFGGYAGTGKSTLIPVLSSLLRDSYSTAFCALTGKAADVLQKKLKAANVKNPGYVGTIHRLMYEPITDKEERIVGWERKQSLFSLDNRCPIKRIIVDEVSMLGSELLEDLKSYDVPILAVGDHGQLPPINGESILTNLDVKLEEIHRQAKDNPIIQLASYIRENGDLPTRRESNEFIRYVHPDAAMETVGEVYDRLGINMSVLVRRNVIRKNFNLLPRESPEPLVSDIVICLKNSAPIYNGMRGIIQEIQKVDPFWWRAEVFFPDNGISVRGLFNAKQFGRDKTLSSTRDIPNYPPFIPMGLLFDFGLSLTVHKAQGSAFEEVILCPEKWSSDNPADYCKWLYTAVTRAVKKLYIVI